MRREMLPLFRNAQRVETRADLKAPVDKLWKIHDNADNAAKSEPPETSLLDLKIEIARRIFHDCHFCERRCHADRNATSGFCGITYSNYSSEFLHCGEERELLPSHTIFFTGCTFSCVFCQNWEISKAPLEGTKALPETLALRVYNRSKQGSRNVNWVGGDPTPHIYTILRTIRAFCDLAEKQEIEADSLDVPMVFNSNAYYSSESAKLLNGVIDIYLSDFKFGNNTCAKRYSKVDNYVDVVTRNLLSSQDKLLIRHLVMPGHIKCCTQPIAEWVRENMPRVKFNLMFQYTPYNVVHYPEINRYLREDEIHVAQEIARDLNLL
ncbi:MAG TPA: radical SAM protein [Candidatus Acidoferrales bacterium]|nr:radical SAM protein [Candidatus Acidoferrales bacterium]